MNAADVAVYLDELALDQRNQLSATGRRALRAAADTLSFLDRQPGFESEVPAYRRVLKAAAREWISSGGGGRYQHGRAHGLVMAIAELRDVEDSEAADLVRAAAAYLTRVDTPTEQVIG